MRRIWFSVLMLAALNGYGQKFNNLALTPPMGWNSWNIFDSDINEKKVREIADVMVSSGMKDAGYGYIVIDDCWQGGRDPLGFIYPDSVKFPSGIKALADYVHSKGFKFGVYSDAGNKTCGGYVGSRGHEYQDAMKYAEWGVDFLKYDWCNTDSANAFWAYSTMRDALHTAGRPVLFSLCEWGNNQPWTWAKDVGHMWRVSGDISSCFDCEYNHGTWSSWGFMRILEMRDGIRVYSGPDHWNDFDMMEVGNGMTVGEDRSHFSLWCMSAAPLIAGNDLRIMRVETKAILTNTDVIAVDQDSLGVQGFRHDIKDSVEFWVKPLKSGDWAVCFLNRSMKSQKLTIDWTTRIVMDDFAKRLLDPAKTTYRIRDLWAKKDLGTTRKKLVRAIPSHDVCMLRLSPAIQ